MLKARRCSSLAVTQKRIAELLNIDRTTVTKALAGNPAISQELRARVRALSEELGYKPNYHSRSLRTRETRVISVLKIGLGLSYLHSMWITYLHKCAHDAGYMVRLEPMTDMYTILAEQSADGFISFHSIADLPQLELHADGAARPLVFTDCGMSEYKTNAVVVNNIDGMAQISSHLVSHGHREVALYGMVADNPICHDRYRGFLEQLNDRGISLPQNRVVSAERWIEEPDEVFQHGDEIVALVKSGVTAIAATSDVAAAGLIKLLRRNGLSVPGDVAVTGFDDSLAARICEPSLTSVNQDVETASQAAIDMLLSIIKTGQSQPRQVVPAKLVIRESTAKSRLP